MNESGQGREHLASRALVSLADTLVADYDVIDLLDRLVAYCISLLSAEAAAIVLVDSRQVMRVMAASSEDAEFMELMQVQSDEGPCLDCYRTALPVSVSDLEEAAHRWPRFATAIADRPTYRSVHALPLRLRGESLGALNLFRHQVGGLSPEDVHLAQALADVATIGILQERAIRRGEVVNEQLQAALNSRVVIEQAKGVISQYSGVDMNTAFNRLRSHARNTNQRLADIARMIVERQLSPEQLVERPARPAG